MRLRGRDNGADEVGLLDKESGSLETSVFEIESDDGCNIVEVIIEDKDESEDSP